MVKYDSNVIVKCKLITLNTGLHWRCPYALRLANTLYENTAHILREWLATKYDNLQQQMTTDKK